jgi:hypothetical protein
MWLNAFKIQTEIHICANIKTAYKIRDILINVHAEITFHTY